MARSKGKVAEREVAKMLQEWWRQVEPDCQFVRTPCSGGWSTPQVRTDFRASGDIMTTATAWPFTVEVKRREAWSPRNLIEGRRSPVWGWWKQSQREAIELNCEPMLWLRRNAELATGKGSGGGMLAPEWLVIVRAQFVSAANLPCQDIRWTAEQLTAVDYGESVPAGYIARRWLEIPAGKLIDW